MNKVFTVTRRCSHEHNSLFANPQVSLFLSTIYIANPLTGYAEVYGRKERTADILAMRKMATLVCLNNCLGWSRLSLRQIAYLLNIRQAIWVLTDIAERIAGALIHHPQLQSNRRGTKSLLCEAIFFDHLNKETRRDDGTGWIPNIYIRTAPILLNLVRTGYENGSPFHNAQITVLWKMLELVKC
jgi:hypothetical protein